MRNCGLLAGGGRHGSGRALGNLLPTQNRQLSALRFHQRCKTFDPITVVAIQNAVDGADLRLVNVAAHHSVDAAAASFVRQRNLEIGDIAHRILDLVLEELRQRPVRKAQPRTHRVEPAIEVQRAQVESIAEKSEPLGILDYPVEKVAVHHQQAAAIGCGMDDVLAQFDAAEGDVAEMASERVVVSGNIGDGRSLTGFA